jgi:uncharacterized membrane protein HdeD (DUF308 family)
MLKSLSFSLTLRGILAIVIGIVSVVWPGITVGAFVILFAVFAFVVAITDFGRAFSSERAGPVIGFVVLAVLSVAAGVVALAWPAITALALTVWVAAWALVTGLLEIFMAFREGLLAGQRATWAIGGLISVAFGIVLLIRPDVGALTLATVFGLFSIVHGVSMLMLATHVKKIGTAT